MYFLKLRFDINIFLKIINSPNSVIAIIGIIISAFLGQYLTYKFQLTSFKHQQREKKRDEFYRSASKLFDELSDLMDRRIYLERKLLSSFRDRDKNLTDKVDDRFNDYNNFLYEWNQSLNKNICRIEVYFGKSLSTHFENRIAKDFNWIGIMLRDRYFKQKEHSDKAILDAIDITNSRVYKFDKEMLKLIQSSLD